jgi:peptidoglycan hydrolase-like protein with peptidoglycan-binding domain
MDPATIAEVQTQLKAAGFDPGTTSGTWDEKTREALRQYQQSKGLTASGQLDEQTRQALLSGGSSGSSSGSGSSGSTPGSSSSFGSGSGSGSSSGTPK